MADAVIRVDVLILGGGIAGLWLLHELTEAGYGCILAESDALGAGQSVAAQGIIHGGLKYTLDGLLNASASAISEMPEIWRACLAGERSPDLSAAPLLSDGCYLWRTDSWTSRLGLVGATFGLKVRPERLSAAERPALLRDVPGDVYRLPEQVIDPRGALAALAAPHQQRLMHVPKAAVLVAAERAADSACVQFKHAEAAATRTVTVNARRVVLTAGGGNESLRSVFGCAAQRTQRRPLHMTLVRGHLPDFYGHCVDGARTRVTISSVREPGGAVVWQLGGQLAEDGVQLDPATLIKKARSELRATVPSLELSGAEWSSYRIDRAEPLTAERRRPDDAVAWAEGPVISAWPTKLALAPRLAQQVRWLLPDPSGRADLPPGDWPRPAIAQPPWEKELTWHRLP